MSDLYGFAYTLDETLKTMEDVISTGNHDRMFLDTYYWLKTLKEYQEIGTVEECREAREKQTPKRPVWKKGRSVICKDYADGHGEVEENKWADWVCPNCGWFVGEQYIPRRHNQQKSNYCSRCGRAIQWDKNLEGMEDDKTGSL